MPSRQPPTVITAAAPRLTPQQVCFIVDDVASAAQECESKFGWGPFVQFKAPIPEAHYKTWCGEKITEVALGMAGAVQVEFLHVHKGRDTTADYQAEYGTGFQHLGIHCKSRDAALAYLESLGATVNEVNEFPGIRFAFVDTPTGPGMFEILQPSTDLSKNDNIAKSREGDASKAPLFELDRATIVTADMATALDFYSKVFGWANPTPINATLRYGEQQTRTKRCLVQAGSLELEFIEPDAKSSDPYSAHLKRGKHGLIHAGGTIDSDFPKDEVLLGEWLESGESFALYHWPGGRHALQIRKAKSD